MAQLYEYFPQIFDNERNEFIMSKMNGIDVSVWQGTIDWNKVKATGIEFAIIKAGGSDDGFYKDSKFETNYKNAKAAGLHVGAYYFVGPKCNTVADGKADAERFIEFLKDKQLDMPVYVDCEMNDGGTRDGKSEALAAFCDTLEDAGYYAGIYGSEVSGFQGLYDYKQLTDFCFWVANWSSKPSIPYGVWQYSSTGKVDGISGNVDLDTCAVDYPTTIVNGGFNNYPKKSSEFTVTSESGDYLVRGDTTYAVKAGQDIVMTA